MWGSVVILECWLGSSNSVVNILEYPKSLKAPLRLGSPKKAYRLSKFDLMQSFLKREIGIFIDFVNTLVL